MVDLSWWTGPPEKSHVQPGGLQPEKEQTKRNETKRNETNKQTKEFFNNEIPWVAEEVSQMGTPPGAPQEKHASYFCGGLNFGFWLKSAGWSDIWGVLFQGERCGTLPGFRKKLLSPRPLGAYEQS